MNDRDEEQFGMILRHLLPQKREQSRGTGCPDDENLAAYLSGSLTETQRGELENHLAACSFCLDELCAAHAATQEGREETVPRRVLDKAMALIPATHPAPDFLELVVRLVRDSLEVVSTTGDRSRHGDSGHPR